MQRFFHIFEKYRQVRNLIKCVLSVSCHHFFDAVSGILAKGNGLAETNYRNSVAQNILIDSFYIYTEIHAHFLMHSLLERLLEMYCLM